MQTSCQQTARIQSRIIKELEISPDDKGRRMWASWEDEILKRFYPTKSHRLIAEKLNRTVDAVTNRAYMLGLKKELS